MKTNTVHTEIQAEVIDECTFNKNFKREFVFDSSEKRISRFLSQYSTVILASNSSLKYSTLEVGVDKEGKRERFVVLQYLDGTPNKFVRITGCNIKDIVLKVLVVC